MERQANSSLPLPGGTTVLTGFYPIPPGLLRQHHRLLRTTGLETQGFQKTAQFYYSEERFESTLQGSEAKREVVLPGLGSFPPMS